MAEVEFFQLDITNPAGSVLTDTVQFVRVGTTAGELGVTANHSPMLATIEPSYIHIIDEKDTHKFYFAPSGHIHVLPEKVQIMAPYLEPVSEIDLERCNQSLKRAKARIESKEKDEIDLSRASGSKNRAEGRISTVEEYRKTQN